jgi:hypothetical protein
LVLLAVFGLAAGFVALPDPHPHRLHAIAAPFQKNIGVTGTIHLHFIGCIPWGTLTRTPPLVLLRSDRRGREGTRRKQLHGATAQYAKGATEKTDPDSHGSCPLEIMDGEKWAGHV